MTVMTRGVVTQNVTERTRALLTRLNLYYAGVGVLALVNLYLLVHMAFAWRAAAGPPTTRELPRELPQLPTDPLDFSERDTRFELATLSLGS